MTLHGESGRRDAAVRPEPVPAGWRAVIAAACAAFVLNAPAPGLAAEEASAPQTVPPGSPSWR